MKLKLNKKNASTIMQHLNSFFKKSTASLHSDIEGKSSNKVYDPELSLKCTWHHMYKNPIFKIDTPILSIGSKYQSNVLPLFEGDVVEFKGSRVIIKELHWGIPRTVTYIHYQNTEEKIEKYLKNALNSHFHDLLLQDDYFSDYMGERNSNEMHYVREVKSALNRCLMTSKSLPAEELLFEEDGLKVFLISDFEEFKKNGLESQNTLRIEVKNNEEEILFSDSNFSYLEVARFLYNYDSETELV